MAVNDAFVMDAWARAQAVPDDLMMLADGNGELTRALGLELDGTGFGMGLRSQRFALYAEDAMVKILTWRRRVNSGYPAPRRCCAALDAPLRTPAGSSGVLDPMARRSLSGRGCIGGCIRGRR